MSNSRKLGKFGNVPFVGNAGKALTVNSQEDGVDFQSLDFLPDFIGNSGSVLKVNSGETGVEWGAGLLSEYQEFTTSGTFTKDPNATWIYVEAIGGGGGGSKGGAGGGGGAFAARLFLASIIPASVPVIVGSGAVGSLVGYGYGGGDSSFGAFVSALGGEGPIEGGNGGFFGGASGCGLVPLSSNNGHPRSPGGYSSGVGGNKFSSYGEQVNGGNCIMGGAGGSSSSGSRGVSQHGGDGGGPGLDGQVPGGGGGGSPSSRGGYGGDGRVRIWQW